MKSKDILSRIFFPEECPLCGNLLKISEAFCSCCGKAEVRLTEGCCENCGKEKELCSCQSKYSSVLSHITGVFSYEGLIQSMLLSFKFGGRRDLYRFFGDSLAERIAINYAKADFDIVTNVPASRESLKERGYNPSALIAKRTAKRLFLPHEELLIKNKETQKQHRLTAEERFYNIKGSISPKNKADIYGKTILLCDDIKTTGATLRECCDVLLSMGAKDVYCAAVAITSNLNLFDLDKETKNK